MSPMMVQFLLKFKEVFHLMKFSGVILEMEQSKLHTPPLGLLGTGSRHLHHPPSLSRTNVASMCHCSTNHQPCQIGVHAPRPHTRSPPPCLRGCGSETSPSLCTLCDDRSSSSYGPTACRRHGHPAPPDILRTQRSSTLQGERLHLCSRTERYSRSRP